ncbi:zinc-ribbon domain-containing protein [Streptomyces sp. OfavH-34-F]|uniref:zinc-ribbon domain-containing protein n=1 Tax=Streptomyces sp. OfavH-34-F TaxID=2917760 RepID=UPI0035B039BF
MTARKAAGASAVRCAAVKGPHEVTPGSSYRAAWTWSRQHLWLAQVRHRTHPIAAAPTATV